MKTTRPLALLAAASVAAAIAFSAPTPEQARFGTDAATDTTTATTGATTTTGTPAPPATPLDQQPAYKSAAAAADGIPATLASLEDGTAIVNDAARALNAFAQDVANGTERSTALARLATALKRLQDKGAALKKATDAVTAQSATGEGSPLKGLDALTGYAADDQAKIDALRARLTSAQKSLSKDKEQFDDATNALVEGAEAATKAFAAALDQGEKAKALFTGTPDGKAVLEGGAPALRTLRVLIDAFGSEAARKGVKDAYASLAAFAAATGVAIPQTEPEKATTLLPSLKEFDPSAGIEAATTSATTTLTTLQTAISKGIDGGTAELKSALQDAEAVQRGLKTLVAESAGGGWKSTAKAVEAAKKTLDLLAMSISLGYDLLQGFDSTFVADTVSLYYFPDVKRLMLTLNPNTHVVDPATDLTGEASGAAQLRAKQVALRDAERAFAVAYGDLAQKTAKLAAVRAEQDESLRVARQTQDTKTIATHTRVNSDKDLTKATNAMTSATNDKATVDADPASTAKQKKAAADRLLAASDAKTLQQERHDRDVAAETKAGAADDAAQARSTQAQKDADALSGDISTLTASAVESARTLRNARFDLQASQEDELKAFAFDRDNKPFYRSVADAGSVDPVKRVVMYAYDDSKVILLRGPRDAVAQVKDIIAQFDAPTPQARITLWSMDMNVQTSRRGRGSLGDVLERVDGKLLTVREQTGEAVHLFREAVNAVVRSVEADGRAVYGDTADGRRMARLALFEPEVCQRLGFDPEDAKGFPDRYYFTRWTVPDPAGTTTLGEALMMYLLASTQHRDEIMFAFEKELRASPAPLASAADKDAVTKLVKRLRAIDHGLYIEFGLPSDHKDLPSRDGLSSEQLEIVNALKRAALEKFIGNAPALCRIYDKFRGRSFSARRVFVRNPGPMADRRSIRFDDVSATNPGLMNTIGTPIQGLLGHDYYEKGYVLYWGDLPPTSQPAPSFPVGKPSTSGVKRPKEETKSSAEEIETAYFLWPAFSWLKHEFGLSPETFARAHEFADFTTQKKKLPASDKTSPSLSDPAQDPLSEPTGNDDDKDRRYVGRCLQYFRTLYPREQANARIAAADEMLKELMVQFEDALDEAYIQPTLVSLRRSLLGDKLDVGQFQRTSMLATNRYVARVAPSATAQLDLSGRTNVLEDAQQLLSFVTAVQTAQIPAIAAALNKLPGKEAAPELYALNGKSSFVVTPIFDPSGQALRFQFDYLKTFNIQSPDGTVNPELPHVESYPISLPVQISNLELREVTRFETNTKLGVPTKYSGGIPILNQIPGLREIPIVGWFSKRDGKAAVSQQTIILAQTATYPTIEDISKLLTGNFNLYLPSVK